MKLEEQVSDADYNDFQRASDSTLKARIAPINIEATSATSG